MCRLKTETWRRCAVAIATALLLLLPLDGSYAFDRDGDGVDEGGLDLHVQSPAGIFFHLLLGLILTGWTLQHRPPLVGFQSSPRSPPTSQSLL